MAEFRGDNRMKWAVTPEEHRPVTIDDVISPVPMNPNRMILSDRFRRKRAQVFNGLGKMPTVCQHSIRRKERADSWRVVGKPEVMGKGFQFLDCS
jgi:hypothetical protein